VAADDRRRESRALAGYMRKNTDKQPRVWGSDPGSKWQAKEIRTVPMDRTLWSSRVTSLPFGTGVSPSNSEFEAWRQGTSRPIRLQGSPRGR
jgi:hypothetical protein